MHFKNVLITFEVENFKKLTASQILYCTVSMKSFSTYSFMPSRLEWLQQSKSFLVLRTFNELYRFRFVMSGKKMLFQAFPPDTKLTCRWHPVVAMETLWAKDATLSSPLENGRIFFSKGQISNCSCLCPNHELNTIYSCI